MIMAVYPHHYHCHQPVSLCLVSWYTATYRSKEEGKPLLGTIISLANITHHTPTARERHQHHPLQVGRKERRKGL